MHTRLILPNQVLDVLSEDYRAPGSPQLAGCKNITYIAQNTTRHGVIFWDQPQRDTHILQAFVAESNSDGVYYHQVQQIQNQDQALFVFNQIHDYLRKELGQIHHVQAKIVQDHSLDIKPANGTPSPDEACSIITQTDNHQSIRITRYLRELHHNTQFVVAATAIPLSTNLQEGYQLSSSNPLQNVSLRLINSKKSEAATYATELARRYSNNITNN